MKKGTIAPSKHKLLFVDDEEVSSKIYSRVFSKLYEILVAKNAHEAKRLLEANPDIAVIIADQRMPGETGIDLLELVLKRYPRIVRIISTAYSEYNVIVDAINSARVFGYIDKPWNMERLQLLLARSIEFYYSSNPDEGLMTISPQIESKISISESEMHDIDAIIKIMGTVRGFDNEGTTNTDKSTFSIHQTGDDLIIGYHSESGINRYVALREYRNHAKIASNSKNSLNATQWIFGISSTNPNLIHSKHTLDQHHNKEDHKPANTRSSEYGSLSTTKTTQSSRDIQIKKSCDEIAFFLVAIRQSFEQLTEKQKKSLKEFEVSLDLMINNYRRVAESTMIDFELLDGLLQNLAENLTPFEIGKEPFRTLVIEDKFPESSISGIFVAHNMLARLFGKTLRHPNSSMILLSRTINDTRSNSATIGFSLLLILPVLILFLAQIFNSQLSTRLESLLTFISIVGIALVGAITTHRGMGKMNLDQKITFGRGNSITIAATGAIAVFVLILSIGSIYIFNK